MTTGKSRPFAVTILAILAAIAAILAIVYALRLFFGISIASPLPIGPESFVYQDWLGAALYGILALIWIWAVRGLWNLDPQAWMFVLTLSILYLILDFIAIIGGSTWQDVSLSILVSALVLILAILPGTKQAFGQS